MPRAEITGFVGGVKKTIRTNIDATLNRPWCAMIFDKVTQKTYAELDETNLNLCICHMVPQHKKPHKGPFATARLVKEAAEHNRNFTF